MKIDAGGLRFALTDYVPDRRMEPHWHETTTVSMVLRGALQEGVGAAEHQAGACALVVKPAAANSFAGAADTTHFLSRRRTPGRYLQVSSVQYVFRHTDVRCA